jgi:hypothetical protein
MSFGKEATDFLVQLWDHWYSKISAVLVVVGGCVTWVNRVRNDRKQHELLSRQLEEQERLKSLNLERDREEKYERDLREVERKMGIVEEEAKRGLPGTAVVPDESYASALPECDPALIKEAMRRRWQAFRSDLEKQASRCSRW